MIYLFTKSLAKISWRSAQRFSLYYVSLAGHEDKNQKPNRLDFGIQGHVINNNLLLECVYVCSRF